MISAKAGAAKLTIRAADTRYFQSFLLDVIFGKRTTLPPKRACEEICPPQSAICGKKRPRDLSTIPRSSPHYIGEVPPQW